MISKNQTLLLIFFAIVLLLIFCGCNQKSSDGGFISTVGTDIQHYLDITVLGGLPIKLNTVIDLYIKNKTADCIIFPYNFGAKIFVYQNLGWVEIPNNIIYASHNDVVLDPRGGVNLDALVSLQPDYSKLDAISSKYRMRIVMIGRLCKKGLPSSQKSADYIEVHVEP
jgi:hypothetical protein